MADGSLVVGVTSRSGDPDWVKRNTGNYLTVLEQQGVQPVLLTPDRPALLPGGERFDPDGDGRLPVAVLESLDGLLLSGGGDVHPRYFGQSLDGAEPDSIDVKRDELELHLARHALAANMPIFGICRGCQVLNVAAGGSMVQHLDGHRSNGSGTAFHNVTIGPASMLGDIVLRNSIAVNTFHHQGMREHDLAAGFVAVGMARPDDWLVEAYESTAHRWVLGVQWHPERLFELDPAHALLWQSYFSACRVRGEARRA